MGIAMGPSGKWIDGISPEGSVVDAARASLAARLTAVAHWLPLAAYHADQDVEHVHRLRVSTRRAVAALNLYGDWLPNKKRRWVKKRLKKARCAAGDARDLDVIAERIKSDLGDKAAPVLAEVKELRDAAQPGLLDVAEKYRHNDRFVRQMGKLLDGIRAPKGEGTAATPPGFGEWATQRLAQIADEFFRVMPANGADTKALHQFRIQAKAIRYVIELLAPAFGPELRDDTYPVVEELQERLGKIQDCVASATHLRKWSRETHDAVTSEQYDSLARQQDARLVESIAKFQKWWTPDRIAALKSGLLFTEHEAQTSEPASEAAQPANDDQISAEPISAPQASQ
jgi:CHAD domain-containing protein